ncbi:MAG TPA: efflux RND transporter periplasmic adaptor subunit [Acidimicrobiia bacterium]
MNKIRRRTWIINGVLAALLLLVGAIAVGTVGQSIEDPEEIRTVAVERGSVVATVSASGELIAPTDVVLDFAAGGRLVEVLVQPGDRVAVGDALAKVDDTDARAQQASARAGVAAAQAGLDRLLNRLTPAQQSLGGSQIAAASQQVEAAQAALARAESVAVANAVLYAEQVEAARIQAQRIEADRLDQVAAAQANLAAAQAAHDQLWAGQTPAQRAVGDAQIAQAEGAVAAAKVALDETEDVVDANENAYDLQVAAADDARDAAEFMFGEAEAFLAALEDDLSDCDADATPELCDELAAAVAQQQALVDQYEAALEQAEAALDSAIAARIQGEARDDQAVAMAEAQLVQAELARDLVRAQVSAGREAPTAASLAQAAAQIQLAQTQLAQSMRATDLNSLDLAEATRDTGLARDAQATAVARSQLAQAQRSLELAEAQVFVNEEPPSDAEVAAATAQVDQAQAVLDRVTRLVEETVLRAPVTGTVARVGADVGEYVGGGALPGGLGFIRLTDVGDLIVEVQFSEADAIRMVVGRPAAVEINARPESLLSGRVIRIDPTATVVNQLVTYGARVALAAVPDDVRPGQTVTVDVIIDEVDDALYVPSSAVEQVGDEAYVTVVDEDGEATRRAVRAGLRGDGTTQILFGLEEGEYVARVGGDYVPPVNMVGGGA